MRTKPPAGTHSPRVLAVDDSPGIRRLLQRWLGDARHEVRRAASCRPVSFDVITLVLLISALPLHAWAQPSSPSPMADEVQRLQQLAGEGDAAAQYKLGVWCANGQGGPQDDTQAVAWLRTAADQGLAAAQYHLGGMYVSGRSVPQDDAEGVAWYARAAAQGYALAQYNLAVMQAGGRGVPRDEVQAAAWLRAAADQGLATAQFDLGVSYASGRRGAQDDGQAVAAFHEAAEQGNADAQLRSGLGYGLTVAVPQDHVLAHMWLSLAASRQSGHARIQAARSRDRVATELSPRQLADAQQRAREWQAAFMKRPQQ